MHVCNNNEVSGSPLHLMIMYMDCTVQSGLQFHCWFGVELRKVSVEFICQESGKTNPEEVCRFINAEFTVKMNPFSVEA